MRIVEFGQLRWWVLLIIGLLVAIVAAYGTPGLVAGSLAGAAALSLTWLSRRLILFLIATLVTVQGYVFAIGSFDPPLMLLFVLLLTPRAFVARWLPGEGSIGAVLFLLVSAGLSLLWSPEPVGVLNFAITYVPFIVIAVVVSRGIYSSFPRYEIVFTSLILVASAHALLTIVFRVAPAIEAAFWSSPFAPFLIEPDTLRGLLNGSIRNNVLDPLKAGGVFINANVAAAFHGVMVGLIVGAARAWRRLYYWLVPLHVGAIVASGSKGGLLTLIVVTLLVFVATLLIRRDSAQRHRFAGIGTLLGATAVIGIAVTGATAVGLFSDLEASEFAGLSTSALEGRVQIWRFAEERLRVSPITGLGFGGWEKEFPVYARAVGLVETFPPHNGFVYLWSQAGVLGLIGGLAVVLTLLRLAVAAIRQGGVRNAFGIGLLWAVAWILIQMQGENFGVLGEAHIVPVIAFLAGGAIGYQRGNRHGEEGSRL